MFILSVSLSSCCFCRPVVVAVVISAVEPLHCLFVLLLSYPFPAVASFVPHPFSEVFSCESVLLIFAVCADVCPDVAKEANISVAVAVVAVIFFVLVNDDDENVVGEALVECIMFASSNEFCNFNWHWDSLHSVSCCCC